MKFANGPSVDCMEDNHFIRTLNTMTTEDYQPEFSAHAIAKLNNKDIKI